MAPLPANNTNRLFLDYSDGINAHTISWRFAAPSSLNAAKAALDDFLTTLSPALYLITVLGARQQVNGTNVSLPTAWTGAGTYGTGTMPAVNAPRELRFLGRGPDGRKVSVSVYGGDFATPGTYRINSADDADIAGAIGSLDNASAASDWVTISGTKPVVYDYADVNFNSFWEAAARG
jgi:hypothetical protein